MHALIVAIRRLFNRAPPVNEEPLSPPPTTYDFRQGYIVRLAVLRRQGVTITDELRLEILRQEWRKSV
jgi:hypothetical protein